MSYALTYEKDTISCPSEIFSINPKLVECLKFNIKQNKGIKTHDQFSGIEKHLHLTKFKIY